MKKVERDNNNRSIVAFYENNELIGKVNYSSKSEYYIEDAIGNFYNGILDKQTIEKYASA